ncbi:hypothetical protein GCM10010508_43510 [Streptomyces naganishii JCM 4654]|uniref:Uncharacterized protein n=1 Tax=Streptomyces naganishii JCM 4654 TaxID=1306179 RepID=A0A919CWI0_9ACTN|nr:hypothetical protein GCM10010508_43510 [Streptomyces naganishii JCM 4654]
MARSYTAGMSFLRDRSPVTPKITNPDGPAIRGNRRSRPSRNGFAHPAAGTTGTRPRPPGAFFLAGALPASGAEPPGAFGAVPASCGAEAPVRGTAPPVFRDAADPAAARRRPPALGAEPSVPPAVPEAPEAPAVPVGRVDAAGGLVASAGPGVRGPAGAAEPAALAGVLVIPRQLPCRSRTS